MISAVAADHTDAEFTVKVTLGDNSISGTYGDAKFEDGVATLKNCTIKNAILWDRVQVKYGSIQDTILHR